MRVDFVLTFNWLDPRLSYFNLKDSFALNALSVEEMKMLWFPELIFTNTGTIPIEPNDEIIVLKMMINHHFSAGNVASIVDESTETYVLREGGEKFKGLEAIRETKVFQGQENHLMSFRF